jgi:hypothetical protein
MSTLFARQFRLMLAASLCLATGWAAAGRAQGPPKNLPLEPQRERGASITPAFEGWYENKDGSFSMLLGYYNRNQKEALDIPVGPNNRVEPGGPDQGQPTHFESGRQWGVFVIKVPKDFGTKSITWTIVANGETNSIPLTLNKGYPISPFEELGMHNTPPTLAFSEGGAKVTGPPVGIASTYTGAVNQPIAIDVWAEDVKVANEASGGGLGRGLTPSVATISVHKFRGPGKVTFDKARVPITTQGGKATIAATFDAPGDYLLRVQANDESGEGGGGFQCCWTNTYVKATIRP